MGGSIDEDDDQWEEEVWVVALVDEVDEYPGPLL
jgi:hypothetical protein